MRYIKNFSKEIQTYLNSHRIGENDGIYEYDTLKSVIIGSFNTVTKFKGREYYLGLDILILMDCKILTKRPGYVKPNFNN